MYKGILFSNEPSPLVRASASPPSRSTPDFVGLGAHPWNVPLTLRLRILLIQGPVILALPFFSVRPSCFIAYYQGKGVNLKTVLLCIS